MPSFRLSHLALLAGLFLTALVAGLQQLNARHERDLLFDAAAARVQDDLVNAVDTEISEFRSALNFLAATHPGRLDQYQAFFSHEIDAVMDNDPGVLFLEFFPADGTDRLVERELALGNDGFDVTLLPTGADERLIVTRVAREATVFDLPLLGLDVTSLQRKLVPERIGPEGFELFILDSRELTAFVNPDGGTDDRFTAYRDHTAFLIGSVTGADGELIGYAVFFQTVDGLLESVTAQDLDGLSVELYVDGIESPVAGRLSPDAPAFDEAPMTDIRAVTTSSLSWRFQVWADADFGPGTGLFDQISVWVLGILATVVAYGGAVRRERTHRRLDNARFELAHAISLARTDPLTGLLNRNGLVDEARRSPADLAATVFFIDLDGFKAVNDSGGHERGDEVLRRVASALTSIFRNDDLVSRLGGDEFVVFTEHSGTSEHVRAVSARINRTIAAIDERVTCSLGVASRRAGEGTDVKDLIRNADAAMYAAKRSGGDGCTVWDTVTVE